MTLLCNNTFPKMRKVIASGMIAVCILGASKLPTTKSDKVAAQTTEFKDVKKDSSVYAAVQWAKNKGIVKGYADKDGNPTGYFGPNEKVTEAQFVKMLSEYIQLEPVKETLPKLSNTPLWSDSYYATLASYGVPLNGYYENKLRNLPVKRGTVAQALSYLANNTNDLPNAILYLLDENISTGQNTKYIWADRYEYFGVKNDLTRGQVISFLYRMNNNGITKINPDVNNNFKSLQAGADKGIRMLDEEVMKGKPVLPEDEEVLEQEQPVVDEKDETNESIGCLSEEEVRRWGFEQFLMDSRICITGFDRDSTGKVVPTYNFDITGAKPGEKPGNSSPVVTTPKEPDKKEEVIDRTPILKDTVTYYDKQYGDSVFEIAIDRYNVMQDKTPYYSSTNTSVQLGTLNIGDIVYPTDSNAFVIKELENSNTSKYLLVTVNEEDVAVKRDSLTANYLVFRSKKAIRNGWNYNVFAATEVSLFQEIGKGLPKFGAPNSVFVTASTHDPVYDLLDAGTRVHPSPVTNGSVIKPKYGTGASTSIKIASKGSAEADGWVPATLPNRYYDSLNGNHRDAMIYDFINLGFLHSAEVLISRNVFTYFKTSDGSAIEANYIVAEHKIFGDFTIKGYSKTEAYRTKKMLEVALPYVFDKQHSNATILKVHKDFIAYADAKPNKPKTVQYKGFSAEFSKVDNDSYRLLLLY